MMVVIQGHSVLYILGSVTIHELGNPLRTSVAVKMSCGCFRHVYQWEWPSIVLRLIARLLICSWLIGLQWACVFCMFLVVLFVHVLSPYFLSGLPVTPRHVGNTPSRRNASKWMNRHSLEPQIHGVQSQTILVIVLFENDYVMIIYWNQLLIIMMVGLCICWFDSYVIDIYYFIGIFVDIYWYVLIVMEISLCLCSYHVYFPKGNSTRPGNPARTLIQFTLKKWWFSIVMSVYQRVTGWITVVQCSPQKLLVLLTRVLNKKRLQYMCFFPTLKKHISKSQCLSILHRGSTANNHQVIWF